MSTQFSAAPVKTFGVGAAALSRGTRVVLSSGLLVAASDTQLDIGVINKDVVANQEDGAVHLINAEGTQVMIAAAAIAVGATVYTAAAGKVSSTQGSGVLRGVAMTAAAADGDEIEVLPLH